MNMNPRQRILSAIHHQPVDRLPTDMWATAETQLILLRHFDLLPAVESHPLASTVQNSLTQVVRLNGGVLACEPEPIVQLWDQLGIDGIFHLMPPYIGPQLPASDEAVQNEWGMGFRRVGYDTGVYWELVEHPLSRAATIADIKTYSWPDPDWYDYSVLPDYAAQCGGRAICCGYSAPFYYHNRLRGLELSMMDPLLNPELTRYLLERAMEFFLEYHTRCFEALRGMVDMTQVTDDFGAQKGLLISPTLFERFYRPALQQAIDLAKSFGLIVFHHDDGDLRPLLPALTEMGVQVLNPLQWRCGDWDLAELKAAYGNSLCFHGGMDNQYTLPFGTADEVRREVSWLIENLASDGTGFILAPCHNLQANTPVENILAMYQAARQPLSTS
jgi:uroporphyrinogen decarboxylase